MRVWVTRARPGAEATAARLEARGHAALVAPLLEVRPIPGVALELGGVGAIAFTSANGVAAFADLAAERGLPVFAVGEATAEAARAAGFSEVTTGEADVAALARLIGRRRRGGAGAVLHPRAREPAGDLTGALAEAGIEARSIAVYETVAATALPASAAEALARGDLDAVLLHSPKAGRVLAALLLEADAGRLVACALSPACAEPLAARPFRAVRVASAPREGPLLDLLGP